RRAAHAQADGAGGIRRVDQPGIAAHQHDLRLLPRLRQRVLALLRRPADGIPGGRARRRAGVHSPAEPVEVSCRRQARRIWRAARLGSAPRVPACRAERRRPRRAGIAARGDAVSLWPLCSRGRVDDPPGARCVQRRPAGDDPGQDPGAGVLRATEHRHPGQDRHSHPRRHAAAQPDLHRSSQTCRPRARHRPGRVSQRGAAIPLPAAPWRLHAAARLAGVPAQGRRRGGLHGARAVRHHGRVRVVALNQFLFDDLGYWGNTDDYYDPRNSYLNEVIDRKTGTPISLSILYMELGRRIGLPLEGVSFPGHFLVRLRLRGGTLVLDPFAGGAPQSEAELRERLQRVIPEGAAGGVAVGELPLEQFLEPASNRQILARVLRNLKGIYGEKDKPERMLEVLNRMLVVAPDASSELRDRGYVYRRLECWRPALKDLSNYVEREPEAPDLDDVRVKLMELSALCARLN